ncbi:hypothetical protein HATV-3_gp83 [Haloarcula tailed virus 3]|uniref:Uncharacterized protein n=1 Tax=Haloarcula tailed virus 3 TaxID=2877990 RepID=A0AAE9BZF2_9CAUD|nr:hypothetical protein M1M35_gp83 [Haloarcula tailed virus 3]UBF23433.1 hypothetical protein HATV-3_gp83 [Haloarcula tailed virus 3]
MAIDFTSGTTCPQCANLLWGDNYCPNCRTTYDD